MEQIEIEVKNHCGWYRAYRLPGDVYGICEPKHFQQVNFFLILGKERALLFDTGMGICPVKPLIRELYDGEIITVNSHFHFDHIGGNHDFEPVYAYTDEYVKHIAETGLRPSDYGDQLDEEMFTGGYPKGFNPKTFGALPYAYRELADGQLFDLGARTLRVLHTPGHSGDGIMLYDETQKILFTGDTFYLGPLLTQFNSPIFGRSDLADYIRTLNRLRREIPKNAKLYCSHGPLITGANKLAEAAELMSRIPCIRLADSNKQTAAAGCCYEEDAGEIGEVFGDGFSIVYSLE